MESTSVPEPPVEDDATVTAGTAVLPTTPEGGTMMAAIVRGVVERTGDCLYLRSIDNGGRSIIVFPPGTTLDDVGVTFPDGTRVPVGASVTGGGGYRSVPEESPNLPSDEINACIAPGVDTWVQLVGPTVETSLDPAGGIDGPVLYARDWGDEDPGTELAAASGELRLVDGCVGLGADDSFVPLLWPFDTRWNDDLQAVVTPNGRTIAIGERIDTGGGSYRAGGVSRFTDSAEVMQTAAACSSTGEVFIIQSSVL